MAYSALIFLPTTENNALEQAKSLLAPALVDAKIELLSSGSIEIDIEGFVFYVDYSEEPHVAEEAEELLGDFPVEIPEEGFLARFEISSDDEDDDLEFSNDFAFICETLGTLDGAVVYDFADGGTAYTVSDEDADEHEDEEDFEEEDEDGDEDDDFDDEDEDSDDEDEKSGRK